jgi:pyruvate formate lyase activating enzyme
VIPNINENEIRPLSEFITAIDPELPVCLLAFRPNFALENHPGAPRHLMTACVQIAKDAGLKNVYWSGYTNLAGRVMDIEAEIEDKYFSEEARLAGSYALQAGCKTHPRSCSGCVSNQACEMKRYVPGRET